MQSKKDERKGFECVNKVLLKDHAQNTPYHIILLKGQVEISG